MENLQIAEIEKPAEKTAEAAQTIAEESLPRKVDMAYILDRIDRIMNDSSYLQQTFDTINHLVTGGPGDIAGQAKADAVAAAVKCRETTNQRLICLLEKMYDDIKPRRARTPDELHFLDDVMDHIDDLPPDQKAAIIREQLNR